MTKQRPGSAARRQKVTRQQAHDARDQLAAGGLSHQDRRRLRAVAGARDQAVRRRRGELRHLLIVAAGIVAAMAVVAGTLGLVPAIQAASGQGVAGTFVVGQPCTFRRGCEWTGTFQSPDGPSVQHVSYDGSLPFGAGDGSSIPAIYPGGSAHVVYPPRGSHAWIYDLFLMLLVGAAVGALLWIFPIGLGRSEPHGAVV
jgi:hypothetical protein